MLGPGSRGTVGIEGNCFGLDIGVCGFSWRAGMRFAAFTAEEHGFECSDENEHVEEE